jgi:hypothetical protein
MNVGDIITRVRRTFGDEAAVQVSDEDVIRWINDAQIEIVKHNDGALQKTDFIDLVANQSTYTMPTDLLLVKAIRYKYSDMQSFAALRYKNMAQFDDTVDGWDGTAFPAGYPYFFTMYEGNVILFPTPDRSVTDGLKILYNQKPADVTDSLSNLALPLIYHNTVVSYCMWQASLLDEDHEPALMYRNNFESDMGILQTRETQQATQTYAVITVLDDDL